jgi:sugar phosphate isomerase/epimerase
MSGPAAGLSHELVAACWMSAGDAAPGRHHGASPVDVRTRVQAVAAAGWSGMGIGHADLVRARETVGLVELGALLAENGIETLELEFIRDWWTTGDRRAESDRVRHDLLEAAGALGVRTIKVGAKSEGEPVDRDRFLAEFDQLATDAGNAGTRVALEPTASSDVLPTIKHGIEVVMAVGNPSGGLAVDCWHTTRSGTSHSELVEILPLESVFVVEIADGGDAVVGSIWNDEVNHRRLPGDGVFDVPAFLVAMHDLGYRGRWGVEVISEDYRRLPVAVGLARAHRAATRTVHAAAAILAARQA